MKLNNHLLIESDEIELREEIEKYIKDNYDVLKENTWKKYLTYDFISGKWRYK